MSTKHKNIYFLCLVLLTVVLRVKANPDSLKQQRYFSFQVSLAGGGLRYYDEHEALKVKHGTLFPVGVGISYNSFKSKHSLFISRGNVVVKNNSALVDTKYNQWQLLYTYSRDLWAKGSFLGTFKIKGNSRLLYRKLNIEMYDQGIETTNLNFFMGIMPGLCVKYFFKPGMSMYTDISYALGGVSFLQRYDNELPYYHVEGEYISLKSSLENAYWQFLGEFNWLDFRLGIESLINESLSLKLEYNYEYIDVSKFKNQKNALFGIEIVRLMFLFKL